MSFKLSPLRLFIPARAGNLLSALRIISRNERAPQPFAETATARACRFSCVSGGAGLDLEEAGAAMATGGIFCQTSVKAISRPVRRDWQPGIEHTANCFGRSSAFSWCPRPVDQGL